MWPHPVYLPCRGSEVRQPVFISDHGQLVAQVALLIGLDNVARHIVTHVVQVCRDPCPSYAQMLLAALLRAAMVGASSGSTQAYILLSLLHSALPND